MTFTEDAPTFWDNAREAAHSLLRAVCGLLLFQAGSMLHFGWPGAMPEGMAPPPGSQVWVGKWIEVVGGALLFVGLGTRWVAFVLSGMMAVAYFQFHQPQGAWPAQNGGAPAVLLCFACLFLWAAGGGRWSLDAMLSRRRTSL